MWILYCFFIMSEPVRVKKPILFDLQDEDIFKTSKLRKCRLLGEGGAGKVFLAITQAKPRRKFAVKTFSFSTDVREKSLRHFAREFQIMQAVSHPHLVPCTVAARCDDYAAITMPYYSGGDLASIGRVEPKRVQRYLSHVAKAVEHLHRNNIAHNDVKLKNVFLDGSDRAHLGDFGLALEVKDESRTIAVNFLGGTKGYLSPERLEAGLNDMVDPFKGDVYAIGVMYWALVSGEKPAAGTDYLDRLRTVCDLDLSDSQRSTLERLLEPSPAHRPTASQVVKMLSLKD